jgi:hypothetical protein
MVVALLRVGLVLLTACQASAIADVCTVSCSSQGACPSGLMCSLDGYCHEEGDTTDCSPDAAPLPDARPAPADAASPPDAALPPDAIPCVAGEARVVDPASGHCYTLHVSGASWPNARAACAGLGANTHLATIEAAAENQVVFSIVGGRRTWLGGTDAIAEGAWEWTTGAPWIYTRWRAGDPTNGGGGEPGEDCLEMWSSGLGEWNDNECYVVAAYVCERD